MNVILEKWRQAVSVDSEEAVGQFLWLDCVSRLSRFALLLCRSFRRLAAHIIQAKVNQ